jgi:alpha-L-fucosidase
MFRRENSLSELKNPMNLPFYPRTCCSCGAFLAAFSLLSASVLTAEPKENEKKPFEPKFASLEKHEVPTWFEDAKLGIFIHWGIYSVPAFAPPSEQFGRLPETEFFKRNPYAEWYFNSMRIEGSATHEHHLKTYGKDFDYYRFGQTFNQEVVKWDPAAMADIFKSVHAQYVVLTTKHHDGFTLWPSEVKNTHRPDAHATRDIVGELTSSVKERGLRMGLYYSGGIDWSFRPVIIDGPREGSQITPEGNYADYADAHLRELIARYKPSVLWNDIRYPEKSGLLQIVADYYNSTRDGVINNRWGKWIPADFTTAEYKVHPTIVAKKWEGNRGIGNSFGFNRAEGPEHMLSVNDLVDSFIDIVSKNGNLLLNVGPQPDGTIPEMQLDRLRGLGKWLDVNGGAIFGTRPWVDCSGTVEGSDVPVRFTYRAGTVEGAEGTVYAFLLNKPAANKVVLANVVPATADTKVRLLGYAEPLMSRRVGDGFEIDLPAELPEAPAYTLEISPQPRRLMRK